MLCIPRVTTDASETIADLAMQMRTSPDIVQDMPSALVGDAPAIVDKLQSNREQFGLSYAVIPSSALDDFAPIVKRLANT